MDVVRRQPNQGWIEVITGSMFSGKSEELIRRVRRAQIARQHVQVFKPQFDDRFSESHVVSHSDLRMPSENVGERAGPARSACRPDTEVVGIDEGQFFDLELPMVCNTLADDGKRVIVAGLDQDYLGKPFEPMPQLLAIAEYITKTLRDLHGVRQPRQPHAAARGEQRPRAARRAGHVRGALPALLRPVARAQVGCPTGPLRPRLPRLRLHHARAQPDPARPSAASRRAAATPAATRRVPTPSGASSAARGATATTPSAIDRSRGRRGRRRRAAPAVTSISRCARSRPASTCSSRSRRCSRPADYLRPPSTRATARGAWCSSARTITTSRSSGRCAALLAEGVIGELVLAHFTTRGPPAEDRRRLAQRRDDGRRRRVLRRGHPLAAPRRQPRAAHHVDRRGSGPRRRRTGPDRRAKSMLVGVPVRHRGGRSALLLARDPVALPRAAPVEAVRPPRRHHLRVERRDRARARPRPAARRSCRACCATSAGTARCTATSSARSAKARAPEMSLERALEDHRLMEQVYAGTSGPSRPAASQRARRVGPGAGAGSP